MQHHDSALRRGAKQDASDVFLQTLMYELERASERGAYQALFRDHAIDKVYEAIAADYLRGRQLLTRGTSQIASAAIRRVSMASTNTLEPF